MRSNKLNCDKPDSRTMFKTIVSNWDKFMDGEPMTEKEFYSESYDEQCAFYDWFVSQYNDTFIIGI